MSGPGPEHRPRFWEELQQRLAEADDARAAAAAVAPVPPVPDAAPPPVPEPNPLEAPMPRPTAPRRRLVVAVAAVTAVVAALAAASLLRPDDETSVTADRPTTTTSIIATTTTTGGPGWMPVQTEPDEAVLTWLDAMGEGDTATAAALVGPRSRHYLERTGGTATGFVTEASEGYGAWAGSEDRRTTEVRLGEVSGVETAVVVVSGTWRGEGAEEFRNDAIPTVREDGAWLVEPVAYDVQRGGVDIVSSDGTIEVRAPGRGAFWFSVDGDDGEPARVDGVRDGDDHVTATWDPPADLRSGTHLLVVAYVDHLTVDMITATAEPFTVDP